MSGARSSPTPTDRPVAASASGRHPSYVDSALDHLEGGKPPAFWRHFHWGLFEDLGVEDDSPERYFAAAEALTERIVRAGGVADGSVVLDVGCGFGGTLDHIRDRNAGCRLFGLNIDLRQLQWGRRLLATSSDAIRFVTADGCRLPVADEVVDCVLAVECVFHFSSRKAFFQEAARVLRPGGTVALSDFVIAPGALAAVVGTMAPTGVDDGAWYGHMARPLTSTGYERLARRTGLELVLDDDVTARTLPTYAALRRLARGDGDSTSGLTAIDGIEALAVAGDLGYHVVACRRG